MGLFKKKVGSHGCTVILRERVAGGSLYIYVPRKGDGGYDKISLGHRDFDVAEAEALKLAAKRRTSRTSTRAGKIRLHTLLALYEQKETPHKAQPGEDLRRIDLWTAFFAKNPEASHITNVDMKTFVRMRKAGQIKLPIVERPDGKGVRRKLASNPKATTIGADIIFLQTVLNWAVDARLMKRNPIATFKAPKTRNPAQPIASMERYLDIYRVTPRVSPMFRVFFGLIGHELDWRVSALCAIKITHIDLTARKYAPDGRVFKAPEKHDEEGHWVPLTPRGRRLFQRALRLRNAIGDVYLFEAPKVPGKPWRRQYAAELLERAERLAGYEPMEGGDFHPYRRKWSTERKHEPWADIAAVSGRKDRKTFEKSYTKADEDTSLRVARGARYARKAAAAAKEVGPKTEPRKVGS
jgi:hypothetical protein